MAGAAALGSGLVSLSGAGTGAHSRSASTAAKAKAERAYGKLPLSFQANRGQTDSRVKFMSRGAGYALFLTPQEAVLSLQRPAHSSGNAKGARRTGTASQAASSATIRMGFAGANPNPQIEGLTRTRGATNYLIGRDPKAWHTGVPSYASALYRSVYPGIDLLYHGKQGQLEYDFQVAPGADPGRIALNFSGARKISLDGKGNLVLDTAAGAVRQHKPVIYQEIAGRRQSVSGRFVLRAGHRVGFHVRGYDRSRTLVIDPTLVYSTYLGGTNGIDRGRAIAVDSSGSAYVSGVTNSADFPTKNAFQGGFRAGGLDAFVSKLTPDGTALAYSTYLGGSGNERDGTGIAVDASGAAYVTGGTFSDDFPLANAFQSTRGGAGAIDAFVTKLKPDGSGLVYSSYLGGDQTDFGNAIAVDSTGAAFVTGQTASSGTGASTKVFPRQNAAQPTYGGGNADAFVAKLNPNDGTSAVTLAYSTFLGGGATRFGDAGEQGNGIALDSSGAAYVTGPTSSANFPTTAGAYDTTCGAGTTTDCNANKTDAFVAKYTPAGTLAYSTFLGASDFDQGLAIAVGRGSSDAGTAYVLGQTSSTDYPTTAGAFDRTCGATPQPSGTNCPSDAFVTKLNAAGSDLAYSTYLGGDGFEGRANSNPGIAVNGAGNAFVSVSSDLDFPIVRPVDEAGSGSVVAELSSAGSDLVFSTFFGGGADTEPSGMALDSAGNAYVTGSTNAPDFPTQTPIQAKLAGGGGGRDVFVAKFSPVGDTNLAAPYVTAVSPRGGDVAGGRRVTITGTGFGGASGVAFGGTPAASFTVDSSTQITAVSPAHAAGAAAVTVTTGQGASPANPISRFAYGEGMFATTGALPFTFGFGGPPTATLLKTGKVLVAGADTDSAALYDPKAGTFTATGSLSTPKSLNTATLLPSGKVLVVGDKGELFDPAAGTNGAFSDTTGAPLFSPDRGTATLLPSGKVLITSGAQAQLYDPSTDRFSTTGALIDAQNEAKAVLLPNGKVLVAGGGPTNRSAELYDPATGAFTRTGSLNVARSRPTLTLLPGGRVLATGGLAFPASLAAAELYDPQTGDWTRTASLDDYRNDHAATLLPSGKVLIVGGTSAGGSGGPVASAELFDPAARGGQGSFMSATRTEASVYQPAVALLSSDPGAFAADPAVCGDNCGKVLVVGRGSIKTASSSTFNSPVAELYTPGAPTSVQPPPPPTGQGGQPSSGLTSSGTTAGPSDTSAPGVSGYGLTNNPFTVGGSTPTFGNAAAKTKKHKKGTTFRYTLSEAATAKIAISQRLAGRRKGKRCVAPTRKLRKAKKCTRIVTRGTLTRISKAGVNRVAFSGRIGSRKLAPGRYQATLTATDAARNTSKPRTISFTIVKR